MFITSFDYALILFICTSAFHCAFDRSSYDAWSLVTTNSNRMAIYPYVISFSKHVAEICMSVGGAGGRSEGCKLQCEKGIRHKAVALAAEA